jgi:hypothetical protein
MMRGRPILGAVAGLFFGLFLSLTLMLWGVWPLDRMSLIGLPVLFMIVGLVLAFLAPLGRKKAGGAAATAEEVEEAIE